MYKNWSLFSAYYVPGSVPNTLLKFCSILKYTSEFANVVMHKSEYGNREIL
jgi:hypothetical protein